MNDINAKCIGLKIMALPTLENEKNRPNKKIVNKNVTIVIVICFLLLPCTVLEPKDIMIIK